MGRRGNSFFSYLFFFLMCLGVVVALMVECFYREREKKKMTEGSERWRVGERLCYVYVYNKGTKLKRDGMPNWVWNFQLPFFFSF